MGSVCSCLYDSEEQEHCSVNCIDYLAWLVDHAVQSICSRRERVLHSDEQNAALIEQVNTRADDAGTATSQPLSNNDPRSSQPQIVDEDGGLVLSWRTKDSRVLENVTGTNSTYRKGNLDGSRNAGSKTCYSEVSVEQPIAEMRDERTTYLYSASDDEDVCSICLEEFTYENPRSTLKCTHEFHLSCIYEWMERSHSCPFCSELMLFTEDT